MLRNPRSVPDSMEGKVCVGRTMRPGNSPDRHFAASAYDALQGTARAKFRLHGRSRSQKLSPTTFLDRPNAHANAEAVCHNVSGFTVPLRLSSIDFATTQNVSLRTSEPATYTIRTSPRWLRFRPASSPSGSRHQNRLPVSLKLKHRSRPSEPVPQRLRIRKRSS